MMRLMFLSLLFAATASSLAQQLSASEQLKDRFIAILKQQLSGMTANAGAENPQLTVEEITKRVDALTAGAVAAYGSLLALPEDEANRLLFTGPDDKANMAAMQHHIELWKKVERPMPTLYKRMQDEVTTNEVKGLELELTRRISEFHLRQLGLL